MDAAQVETLNKVIRAINSGELDSALDAISNQVKNRRQRLDAQKVYMYCIGDVVQFNDKCRPQYMQGEKATIKSVDGNKFVVDMHRPVYNTVGRIAFDKGVKTSPQLVDVIDRADLAQIGA